MSWHFSESTMSCHSSVTTWLPASNSISCPLILRPFTSVKARWLTANCGQGSRPEFPLSQSRIPIEQTNQQPPARGTAPWMLGTTALSKNESRSGSAAPNSAPHFLSTRRQTHNHPSKRNKFVTVPLSCTFSGAGATGRWSRTTAKSAPKKVEKNRRFYIFWSMMQLKGGEKCTQSLP